MNDWSPFFTVASWLIIIFAILNILQDSGVFDILTLFG